MIEMNDKQNLKSARYMVDTFNKDIKKLSSMCYIDHNGLFYLKSDNSKMERFGLIYDPELLELFKGSLYDTIELHEFSKLYRFSTSTFGMDDDKVVRIGQNEKSKNPDAYFDFNIITERNPKLIDEKRLDIIEEFYKKFFKILDRAELDPEKLDHLNTFVIKEDEIERLSQSEMLMVKDPINNKHAYITKALFPNLSHAGAIEYTALDITGEYDDKCAYFIFKEYNDTAGVMIFTLIAAYQNV